MLSQNSSSDNLLDSCYNANMTVSDSHDIFDYLHTGVR